MSPAALALQLVAPKLKKCDMVREPLSPAERLLITLAYLVSGDEQKSIAKDYRVGRSTVCVVVHETCSVIYEILRAEVLPPLTPSSWKNLATEFGNAWNFPNCVGSIDGKHFRIPKPANTGSQFYCYKGFCSVVLLGICDGNYKFIYVNAGAAGAEIDGGIFRRCTLGKQLLSSSLDLPDETELPQSRLRAPYVFVGDEAFPLLPNLMRPFPGSNLTKDQRVFNYRHSRARRTIENSFGILVARWRLLNDTTNMSPNYATAAILACVMLHNWVKSQPDLTKSYIPHGFVDYEDPNTGDIIRGTWRQKSAFESSGRPLDPQGSRNFTVTARSVRETFTRYFMNAGGVSWQDERIKDF